MTNSGIRLVTRGDDAGSCASANEAIRDAFLNGILRNTSVMAPAPHLEHAAELLSDLPGLCLGLHVTLTSELRGLCTGPVLPVEQVAEIVDEDGGFFPRVPQTASPAALDQMVAEVEAQLDLLRAKGFDVRYMDEHMMVGRVPGLRERLAELAGREGLVKMPKSLRGLPRVAGDFENPLDELIARLDAAEPGTYLIVGHPCYDCEEVRRLWTGRPSKAGRHMREWERRMFVDARVIGYCQGRGIEPIRYTEVEHDC